MSPLSSRERDGCPAAGASGHRSCCRATKQTTAKRHENGREIPLIPLIMYRNLPCYAGPFASENDTLIIRTAEPKTCPRAGNSDDIGGASSAVFDALLAGAAGSRWPIGTAIGPLSV